MKEFDLIKKFFRPLAKSRNSLNLTDDVAILNCIESKTIVVSKDMMAQDVHFRLSDGGFKIASKLLLSNLSDLAASGATPLHYMLGFSKFPSCDQKFLRDFSKGLAHIQQNYNITLIGGDTINSATAVFSITIFGEVDSKYRMFRGGACVDDLIFVSGTIGDAGIGLECKEGLIGKVRNKNFFLSKHFFPEPRILLGTALSKKSLSTCAIDISDGLFSDLSHICTASNLKAEIFLDQIPISPQAKLFLKQNPSRDLPELISAGEDYELLFTAKEVDLPNIMGLEKSINTKISCIGRLNKFSGGDRIVLHKAKDLYRQKTGIIKIKKFGYEH